MQRLAAALGLANASRAVVDGLVLRNASRNARSAKLAGAAPSPEIELVELPRLGLSFHYAPAADGTDGFERIELLEAASELLADAAARLVAPLLRSCAPSQRDAPRAGLWSW